jgi:hypothetical protein
MPVSERKQNIYSHKDYILLSEIAYVAKNIAICSVYPARD